MCLSIYLPVRLNNNSKTEGKTFGTFQCLCSSSVAVIYQDVGTLRLSWVQCLTDVLQWVHIFQRKRVFILPLLYALWRMADQLIMETCSSGILSRTDVCHKHLVLVIQLRTLRRLWIGRISSGLFSFERADSTGRRSREPPITKQPGAPLLGCETTILFGQIYFQRGTKMHT